jgi:hypothetical protein
MVELFGLEAIVEFFELELSTDFFCFLIIDLVRGLLSSSCRATIINNQNNQNNQYKNIN